MKKLFSGLICVLGCLLIVSESMAKDEDDKLDVRVGVLEEQVLMLQEQVAALESLLANVTRGVDPNTGYDTIQFSGMNVQIVNGLGSTVSTANGTGNLIIGYNETRPAGGDDRNGSHVLVIGEGLNYSPDAQVGIVFGQNSGIFEQFTAITGGVRNENYARYGAISGGDSNFVIGPAASISGGYGNRAHGQRSSIVGGYENQVQPGAHSAVIVGGWQNQTRGDYSSILGGSRGFIPELIPYETITGLEMQFYAHTGNSEAHHARYIDAEAISANEPYRFSGDHDDLVNVRSDQHHVDFEPQLAIMESDISALKVDVASVNTSLQSLESEIGAQGTDISTLQTVFDGVNRGIDPNTGYDTIQFSGMNLQIVNGSGITSTTNGTGNLILGYNELREDGNIREGSHVLVIGPANNYTSSSHSGIVFGRRNEISNRYASVLGGEYNLATGEGSVAIAGDHNQSGGRRSVTVSGLGNVALAQRSVLVAGAINDTPSLGGDDSAILGGRNNLTSGAFSAITGGEWNHAGAWGAVVSGGYHRQALEQYDWVAGDYYQDQ